MITNKKGVTLLEGLIALALLAMVAVGTFSVLLSSSRKSSGPDKYEEMLLAVERVHHGLQVFNPAMVKHYLPRNYFIDKDSWKYIGYQDNVGQSFFGPILKNITRNQNNPDQINPLCPGEGSECEQEATVNYLLPLTCKWSSSNQFNQSNFTLGNGPEKGVHNKEEFDPWNDTNRPVNKMISNYGTGNLMDDHTNSKLVIKRFTILCLDEKDGI